MADDNTVTMNNADLADTGSFERMATDSLQPLEVIGTESALAVSQDDDGAQQAIRELENRRKQRKRKRRNKIIIACAIAGGIAAVLFGRSLLKGNEPEEEYVPEVAVVERGSFQSVISSSGALKAGSTVMVTPEVDGVIESISVIEGQQVNEGDVLFSLKNDSLDKAIRDAAQDVQTAQQGVASAQNGVSQAQASRDDAWSRYNEAWNEANEAHSEWEYLSNNYSRLHASWQARKDAAESLACGEPQDPGMEPTNPTEPVRSDYPDDASYRKAKDEYDQQKKAYTDWLAAEQQFIADTAAYKAYLDALAGVGEEPQPAGAEPTYPEAPDDISLVAAIESAQDAVTSANTALKKANEAYDETVKNAEKRIVKAPISGNVVAVGGKVGEAIGSAAGAAGGTASGAIVQISDVNKMAIDIEVNEIDILSVKQGQHATVTFSAVPDVEIDARVVEVATVASGSSEGANAGGGGGIVTFHVGLVIDQPDDRLRPGMTAQVKIYTVDIPDALMVPLGAVTEDGAGSATVEVVLDEETMETETRTVALGERNSSQVVITSGLEEGESVLVGGGFGAAEDEFVDEEFAG